MAKIKDAASVILVRHIGEAPHVLMGKRAKTAAFMPSKFVFPGGAVDAEDIVANPKVGAKTNALLSKESEVPAKALIAAAIREVSEETGQRLAADHLHFVFRALTPKGKPRRFDARFFLADASALESDPDDFSKADGELSHLAWLPLYEARKRDLPFITSLVLAEVGARLKDANDRPVPFVDNRSPDVRYL